MPSWNDGEYSKQSYLGDLTDMDYTPDCIEDPIFIGIAADCPHVCRLHKLPPMNCIAFEGTNTGSRFWLCQVQNEATNHGFVAWLGSESPQVAKNALAKLWGLYDDKNSARIDEKIQNAKLLQELAEEKSKIDKKYSTLLIDVKRFMDESEKKIVEDNLSKMKGPQKSRPPC